MREFDYNFNPDGINSIIEEKGNTFIAIREIRWDRESEYKLDVRRYTSTEDGEIPKKGISFYDPNTPTELICALLENDYGDDNTIGKCIFNTRPKLATYISKLQSGEIKPEIPLEDEDDSSDYFDPRELEL